MPDGRTALGTTDCERIRPGTVAQPSNTATSLAFVAAAEAVRRASARPDAHRHEALAYGGLLALVGAGSVAFHGPQPRGAQVLHDAPIAGLLVVTVATPVVLTDLVPTLLEAAGIEPAKAVGPLDGVTLTKVLRGGELRSDDLPRDHRTDVLAAFVANDDDTNASV